MSDLIIVNNELISLDVAPYYLINIIKYEYYVDVFVYEMDNYVNRNEDETINDIPCLFNISVRADGCANWFFNDQIHTCGYSGVQQLSAVISYIAQCVVKPYDNY